MKVRGNRARLEFSENERRYQVRDENDRAVTDAE
jgi:hypothetical protein